MKRFAVRFLFFLATLANAAHAEEWPKGYVIYERSISPDKRFGILIPGIDSIENNEDPGDANYLVNLENHVVLGNIDEAAYFEHANHIGLTVQWAPDSSVCVATYEARYGFHSVSAILVRNNGRAVKQLKFGHVIQEALDRAISRSSKDSVRECDGELTTRIDNGTIQVRAMGQNNPKALDDIVTFYAYFHGTYDLKSGKWIEAAAIPLTLEQYQMVGGALDASPLMQESPEADAKHLDAYLNHIYQAMRFVLPPERFTRIRSEQIAWLKTRDATSDITTKNRMVRARIEALKKLNW